MVPRGPAGLGVERALGTLGVWVRLDVGPPSRGQRHPIWGGSPGRWVDAPAGTVAWALDGPGEVIPKLQGRERQMGRRFFWS